MRRVLGVMLAALALAVTAGCGDSSSTATDPAGSPTSNPASDPAGVPSRSPGTVEGARVLPLISMTGAGGREQPAATLLNSRDDVKAFARELRLPAMWHRIDAALRSVRVPSDRDVVGQIVAVGCDVPPGVDVVVDREGDVVLVPHEVASPLQECLAPVTTVAIAILPPG